MSKTTKDPEFDDNNRKFSAIEQAAEKMLKDAKVFRDAVQTLLYSGSTFSTSFTNLFSPMGAEYDLIGKHPQAEVTLKNIGQYQVLMEDLRETLAPELELIDSRILTPCKELQEIAKKIRKTITKRDHKLIDYDRHNNALNKLREKKEKSLSDEKNLFKVEQDFEIASNEYEHYNNLLKQELPVFFQMATKFIDPLFHSFYYMQLNVFYLMHDKLQSFVDGKYDVTNKDIESIYFSQRGDAAEKMEELQITKRMISTAKLMQTYRSNSGSGTPLSPTGKAGFGRTPSVSSSSTSLNRQSSTSKASYNLPPPIVGSSAAVAPPPYSAPPGGVAASGSIKKAPPPPPPIKTRASGAPPQQYCVALFDFTAQAEGDLSFKVGDRIEIVERSESQDDWWTGRLNGVQGVFPGSYTQLQ
jgi:amphiphysin